MREVLVLGGSKGLGLACVEKFLENDFKVYVFSRTSGNLKQCSRLTHLKTDLSSVDSIHNSLEKIKSKNISIIINNSGGPESKPFLETEPDDMIRAFESHLIYSYIITKHFLPKMITNKFGRIINIVSVTANNPLSNMIVSNSLRGAMINWSKTLSKEYGCKGITVNNLLPRYTKTERLDEVVQSSATLNTVDASTIYSRFKSQIPANRFGEPKELVETALFLAGEKAGYINGQSISIDGG